jgi:6-phosphofructokinase 1
LNDIVYHLSFDLQGDTDAGKFRFPSSQTNSKNPFKYIVFAVVSQARNSKMVSSSSNSNTTTTLSLVVTTSVCVVASAYATYVWTKRNEERKQREIQNKIYQREKILKEKTAHARAQQSLPPSGTLVEDVKIDQVYLWELEDLKKRFPSADIPNVMKFIPIHGDEQDASMASTLRAAHFRRTAAQAAAVTTTKQTYEQPYNKLITNHECILGEVVRKPNMASHTVAYMRAGPRQALHFDPQHVSAAIVTCGGLCPGLNNVIREITNTLKLLYGISGKVYGIQGGYQGFHSDNHEALPPIELTPALVENIHHEGGTVLGSSRGGFDLDRILDFLNQRKISQLYVCIFHCNDVPTVYTL